MKNKIFSILIILLLLISIFSSVYYLSNIFRKLQEIDTKIEELKEINKTLQSQQPPPPTPSLQPLKPGEKAPNFEMESIDKKIYSLPTYYNKKNVILLAWIVSCPHCKEVLEKFNSYYEKLDQAKTELLSVTRTLSEENKREVENFVKEKKIKFPVLLSTDEKFGIDYRITSVPVVWVIDKEGKISKIYESKELKEKSFEELFKEFLK